MYGRPDATISAPYVPARAIVLMFRTYTECYITINVTCHLTYRFSPLTSESSGSRRCRQKFAAPIMTVWYELPCKKRVCPSFKDAHIANHVVETSTQIIGGYFLRRRRERYKHHRSFGRERESDLFFIRHDMSTCVHSARITLRLLKLILYPSIINNGHLQQDGS